MSAEPSKKKQDVKSTRNEYDVIVVGSGVGGTTVAREMSRRGKKVLLLERGGNWTALGNSMANLMVMQWSPLIFSKQLSAIYCTSNYGGASVVSCGAAVPPPKKVFDKVGIDLSVETEEARSEMWINKMPDVLVGPTTLRLLECANDLGYHWTKLERFVDVNRCVPNCSDCMLGCPRGAKWTGRIYGDDMLRNGGDLQLNTKIMNIIVENGKAVGVQDSKGKKYYGKKIILSAGVGNVGLLRRAGLNEAGRSFAVDYLQFIGGVIPHMNSVYEQPMTIGTQEHYEEDGFILVPVFTNWYFLAILLTLKGPWHYSWLKNAFRSTGIMVKVQDELAGEIYPDNFFYMASKTPSERDKKRLKKGADIVKRVLRRAGATDNSFMELPPMGAHPSATCRINDTVDKNLQTRIENLYCCDASVVPESLGEPVVWTVVALGKRLAKHLDAQLA
ncbi:MAG: GMC family oxidoreductase N-terminal domain-containing protein [Deltaproteobacteria bacterium]|nr:GMC family oxidoreductase N-terminal domain-containing protein [Deltaproteobacteria bacterium]